MFKKLRDIELPFKEVRVSEDNSFLVRGISFSDITYLVNRHGPALAVLFGKISDQKSEGFTSDGISALMSTALSEFPETVASVIALAAGEPDTAETVVSRLPLPVQIDAIEKIFGLTFVSEGELKNLFETVARMMARTSGAMEALTAPDSVNGNGAFASR